MFANTLLFFCLIEIKMEMDKNQSLIIEIKIYIFLEQYILFFTVEIKYLKWNGINISAAVLKIILQVKYLWLTKTLNSIL